MQLFIVANSAKPQVQPALEALLPWLEKRVKIVGIETDQDSDLRNLEADIILILGGDGTLLSVARRLHGRQIPIMGVNFGRLGFLASFTPDNIQEHFQAYLNNGLPIRPRMMIEASVVGAEITCCLTDDNVVASHRRFMATALNDAVITAGAPFHMIDLEIAADGESGVSYSGDGVITSTPSGSTAYNVSAGGPIISPKIDALAITPLCPHSLAFRPVVLASESVVIITAVRVNEGTTLFCDGQASTHLRNGDKVIVRRSQNDLLLVENPDAREWRSLAEKLHWAIPPRYRTGP